MSDRRIWTCPICVASPRPFTAPLALLERFEIRARPACGCRTPIRRPLDKAINRELRDPKLVARVRALIRAEHAGYVAHDNGVRDRCLEPSCSCRGGVSGPFRDPPVRCSLFEQAVLPLDPALEEAYWNHLRVGTAAVVRRCKWPTCRRATASLDPNARYCALHARLAERQRERERARAYRERRKAGLGVTVLPSGDAENKGLARRFPSDPVFTLIPRDLCRTTTT